MKLGELKRILSELNDERDIVMFANGYKEIDIVTHEDGIIITGVGKVCPSVKTAIENAGKEPEPCDLCSCGDDNLDCSKIDRGE